MRENQFHVAEIALLLLRLEANFLFVFPYVREQKEQDMHTKCLLRRDPCTTKILSTLSFSLF